MEPVSGTLGRGGRIRRAAGDLEIWDFFFWKMLCEPPGGLQLHDGTHVLPQVPAARQCHPIILNYGWCKNVVLRGGVVV